MWGGCAATHISPAHTHTYRYTYDMCMYIYLYVYIYIYTYIYPKHTHTYTYPPTSQHSQVHPSHDGTRIAWLGPSPTPPPSSATKTKRKQRRKPSARGAAALDQVGMDDEDEDGDRDGVSHSGAQTLYVKDIRSGRKLVEWPGVTTAQWPGRSDAILCTTGDVRGRPDKVWVGGWGGSHLNRHNTPSHTPQHAQHILTHTSTHPPTHLNTRTTNKHQVWLLHIPPRFAKTVPQPQVVFADTHDAHFVDVSLTKDQQFVLLHSHSKPSSEVCVCV